jgi:hypothetical protein
VDAWGRAFILILFLAALAIFGCREGSQSNYWICDLVHHNQQRVSGLYGVEIPQRFKAISLHPSYPGKGVWH